jgi:hypothetical protein
MNIGSSSSRTGLSDNLTHMNTTIAFALGAAVFFYGANVHALSIGALEHTDASLHSQASEEADAARSDVRSIAQSDTSDSAADSSSTVSFDYSEPANLFGIFPVTLSSTVVIDDSGHATIARPWYAFLTDADMHSLQADVQAAVLPTLSAHDTVSGFSAAERTELIGAIRDAIKANIAATAAADASANISQ